jgi:hypothetical protein
MNNVGWKIMLMQNIEDEYFESKEKEISFPFYLKDLVNRKL